MLADRLPARVNVFGAFADDLGVGCADVFSTLAAALPILNFGARASGLKLNLSKTVVMRVMNVNDEYIHRKLLDAGFMPWSFRVVQSGKYFGIILGQS
eukprot:4174375-Pyramimonas_sp.AAC.1